MWLMKVMTDSDYRGLLLRYVADVVAFAADGVAGIV